MREFFRSRFFIVVVIIALILTIVPAVFGAMGLQDYLKNAVNTLLTPVQRLFTCATDAVDGFTSYFTEFDRIVEENNQLREEILELQDKISSADEISQINEWLYGYLELKREHTDYSFQPADVSGYGGGNYMTVYILNKGTAQGVEKDMPVISSEGIVGYITEAGTDWSKVVTILEPGTAVGAYVERSGEVGVVEADYSLAADGLCKLSYLAADADVQVGDRILSSGYGSVYPRGLVIGYVTAVEENPYNRSVNVYIQPAAPMDAASRLMIITKYDAYTE